MTEQSTIVSSETNTSLNLRTTLIDYDFDMKTTITPEGLRALADYIETNYPDELSMKVPLILHHFEPLACIPARISK